MKLVIVESPYAGDVAANETYARSCMADCLARDEAPYASHLLYTQPGVLDDTKPAERAKGMAAGFAWRRVCLYTVVYVDRGISGGMRAGIESARMGGGRVEYRSLDACICAQCGLRLNGVRSVSVTRLCGADCRAAWLAYTQ